MAKNLKFHSQKIAFSLSAKRGLKSKDTSADAKMGSTVAQKRGGKQLTKKG